MLPDRVSNPGPLTYRLRYAARPRSVELPGKNHYESSSLVYHFNSRFLASDQDFQRYDPRTMYNFAAHVSFIGSRARPQLAFLALHFLRGMILTRMRWSAQLKVVNAKKDWQEHA